MFLYSDLTPEENKSCLLAHVKKQNTLLTFEGQDYCAQRLVASHLVIFSKGCLLYSCFYSPRNALTAYVALGPQDFHVLYLHLFFPPSQTVILMIVPHPNE